MSRTLFGSLAAFLAFSAFAWAAEPATEKAPAAGDKPPAKKKEAPPRFMRISRDDKKQPVSLDTAVITYVPAGEKYPGVTLDLVGAIHVGDKSYYDELNKLFDTYDVLLYELVAPEGHKIPKGGVKPRLDHPISAIQGGMKEMLDLDHQLECVDYTKKNFVHADMTPDEFAKSMTDKGDGMLQMMFRMMGQGIAVQSKGGGGGTSDFAILMALFSKDRARQLKLVMAQQFEAVGIDGGMAALEGPEGSTIITERNKRCFAVMEREIGKGHKKIGIFYGAGHFNDMEKRLLETYGFKRQGEKWVVAWDLTRSTPKK